LRKTKVCDLGFPIFGEENVGRLNITVNDSTIMCVLEGVGNLYE
jgi:hypothetical protein